MYTKLIAAELASSAGCSTIITLGSEPKAILQILSDIMNKNNTNTTDTDIQQFNEPSRGTLFVAQGRILDDRKWWISHSLASFGTLTIDEGAMNALLNKGSLFAAGIIDVQGTFASQQCVTLLAKLKNKTELMDIGKALVNYSSLEITRIKGCQSIHISEILGYCETEEVIHRNNLALNQEFLSSFSQKLNI